ncbi:hypothetical protein SASPL_109114 [Salvia splendens]|uniref:MSP domain-containing protein n=1 Tax=Salvia splendens TaxID=180675 RepID=A0A8X9A8V0_SALSN|nr:hypothetical protein SASPL_109114 [Salvia splendens]
MQDISPPFPFSLPITTAAHPQLSGGQIAILSEMSNADLLQIEPLELQFPFELKKQISCSMRLFNKTDNFVAFKVKTTNPKKYCVRPNTGVVAPHSTCDVIVTMQAQKEAPPDMQCRDKFLLQSVVVSPGSSAKDITAEMFSKDSGNQVDECKLRVTYVPPQQPPSPVREGSEEGSSPRASVSDNGTVDQTFEFNNMSKGLFEQQESSLEAKSLISRLTEEKRSAIQQNNKLQQELVIYCFSLVSLVFVELFLLGGGVKAEKRWGRPDHVRYRCLLDRHPIGVPLEENMIEGRLSGRCGKAAACLFKSLGFEVMRCIVLKLAVCLTVEKMPKLVWWFFVIC